jgi:nickel-dependent lactate racemase
VTVGHPLEALEAGLPHVRAVFTRRIARPVDLLVAAIEPPLDRDVYQADKGIKNTERAVRDGGVLIVEAACRKGVGIDHFVELLRRAHTHAEALAVVEERGYRLGDHKAVRLRALTDVRGIRVALVSPHVDAALGGVLGMRIVPDLSAAARWARPLLVSGATGIVIEDAGNVALEIG